MKHDKLIKLFFILIIVYYCFNIFAYIQQVTIKIQIIKMSFIVLGCLGLFLFHLFNNKTGKFKIATTKNIFILYISWIIYSILSALLLLRLEYNVLYIFFSLYLTMFFYILFIALLLKSSQSDSYSQIKLLYSKIYKLLVILLIPIVLLGLLQLIAKQPIIEISTASQDSLFRSDPAGYRPTSFFTAPAAFGFFCLVVFLFSITSMIFIKKNIYYHLPVSIIALSGVLLCQARSLYIATFYALLTLLFLILSLRNKKIKFLLKLSPIIHLIIAISIIIFGVWTFLISPSSSNEGGVTNTATAVGRLIVWTRDYEGYINNANPIDLLFGYGIFENPGNTPLQHLFPATITSENGGFGVDNFFLQAIIYQGMIGLMIFTFLYFSLWKNMIILVYKHQDPFIVTGILLFSTFLGMGMTTVMGTSAVIIILWSLSIVSLYKGISNYDN